LTKRILLFPICGSHLLRHFEL